jgi:hypothetical protein
MSKPIVSFLNFANAPKNYKVSSATKVIFMEVTIVCCTVTIIKYDVSETAMG